MKVLSNTAPDVLEMQTLPMPEPGSGWVRIRTRCVGICSTDLKMIAGWDRTGFPAIPGHEWAGIVDFAGDDVNPDLVGRLCVADNILPDGGEVGFEHPGGYAEYFLTRAENIYCLPDYFPPHHAALIEPIAVCLHALSRLEIDHNQPILIFGDGPIGLLLLAIVRKLGVEKVCLVGGLPNRLAVAQELGAQKVFNYFQTNSNFYTSLRDYQFPTIVEASGASSALELAFDLTPRRGCILILGDYEDARANFFWNDLLHREIEIVGSNASAGAWQSAVQMAVNGNLPLDRIITHQIPYYSYADAIETADKRKSECIKVMMEWPMLGRSLSNTPT
jgi:2-desacetyl-2-hydroxyethyl bacteriochlorophyllide A dehydrogenase